MKRKFRPKLSLKWTGPFRVTRVLSNFLYELEDLRNGLKEVVHGSRVKFFRNKDYEVTEECLNQLAYQDGELCMIDSILDLRELEGTAELLVKWRGFDDETPSWEDYNTMRVDVPNMVSQFLRTMRKDGDERQRTLAARWE